MHKVCFERLIDEHSTYRDLLTRIKVIETKLKWRFFKKNNCILKLVKNVLLKWCMFSYLGLWCVLVVFFSGTKWMAVKVLVIFDYSGWQMWVLNMMSEVGNLIKTIFSSNQSESNNQSVSQFVHQSVSQSVSQSDSQTVGQSVKQSVSQSVSQFVSQSVSHPVKQSVSQSVS